MSLLSACDGIVYSGDGKLTDRGPLEAHNRYFLDLGPVDLTRPGRREYKLSRLPNEQFAVGFRTTATTSSNGTNLSISKPLSAKVRIELREDESRKVFDVIDDLRNWTWNEARDTYTFLYYEGPINYGRKPYDRGTVFSAQRSSDYRLTVETITPDSTASQYSFRLVAMGGGWK